MFHSVHTRIAVIVATVGRPELVPVMVERLERQTRPADTIVISAATSADVDQGAAGKVLLTYGRKGLTRQRNRGLDLVEEGSDLIVFFDDDFIMAKDWLEQLEKVFRNNPDVSCVTGDVLADGINGPGIPLEEAQRLVEEDEGRPRGVRIQPYGAPYGCNMAFRKSAIGGIRFDERLPLYGWQEDLDFGARLPKGTRTVKAESLRGVHMGIKSGRVSGVRLGASQVINNAYLWHKGTMPLGKAIKFAGRNVAANLLGSVRDGTYIDRRGRLRGNLIGLWQLARGRFDPEFVERL